MLNSKIKDFFLQIKQHKPANFSPLMLMQVGASGFFLIISLLFLIRSLTFSYSVLDTRQGGWRPPVLEGQSPFGQIQTQPNGEAFTRPFFNKSRKPSEPDNKKAEQDTQQTQPATPVDPPPGALLTAIIKNGKIDTAYIISTSDPQGKWYKIGDSFEGWSVVKIEADKAQLKSGELEATLNLYKQEMN